MNDIVVNKIQSIQRCVMRAREEYGSAANDFDVNFTAQDAAVLNVVRACEQAIELANVVIKERRLGVPVTSAESFDLLQQSDVIDGALAGRLKRMTGFRNVVIHNYQRVEIAIVASVIETGLDDLVLFGDRIRA